jgi:tetratricopeptide (TPR) repeat protein
MRRTSLLLANFLFCLAYAQAQRELLGKLVKGDDQSRAPVENVSVSLDEDGSRDVTKSGGLFHLFLSDLLKPGVEVTITVTMPGYAVYEPPGGKLIVPVDLIHRKEIQLLPKGSPKFLSDAQLRAFVERTAKESSRSTTQPDIKQPPDLSRYLKDWAVQYGFSVDQVQAEVSRWASEVESRKSSGHDLALAAFARNNFSEAHDRAMEAAEDEEDHLASLQKQQKEGIDRIIRDYRLAGDAAYNALDFAKASDAYKRALAHFSQDGREAQWADLHSQLGNAEAALISRSEGTAISAHEKSARNAYRAALTVYTREQLPQEWAMTQNNLGAALEDMAGRSEGSQASQYLQQAVDAYRSTLQVYTREQLPQNWAMTQNNLGVALQDMAGRSEGAQASQYLQQAIDDYHSALQVRTREQQPQDWAMTQNNLGVALEDMAGRSEGAKASQYLLEQAVDAYHSALQVYTREQLPQDWARTQNNLGCALDDLAGRSEGAQASQYLQQAVDAYHSALLVRTREQLPQDWATTQNNLGNIFYELAGRSEGAQASQYLQQAVDAYHNALQVRTREQLPRDWATTENNLGAALKVLAERSEGAQASQYLQQAIDDYHNALQVRTREQLPQGWATTQNNLGSALRDLARRSERAQASQYLQQAVDAYESVLQVYAESKFPARWALVTRNLAGVYEEMRDWVDAYKCYEQLLSHDPTNQFLQAKVKELSAKGQS